MMILQVAEGTKDIKVGDLIALTVEQGEDWKSVEMPSGASAGASSGAPAAASTPAPAQEAAPKSTTSEAPPPGQYVKHFLFFVRLLVCFFVF